MSIIMWPKGSIGYNQERVVVSDLLKMCKNNGFGRIPQMAQQIEAMWRDKEKAQKKFVAIKKKHFKMMREGWKDAFGDKPCVYTDDRL